MINLKIHLLFYTVIFVGVAAVANIQTVIAEEEEWTESFEAFKPAEDPKFHQRNTGGIKWGLFQEQPNEDTKGKPGYTDVYWIQGEKGWVKRIKDAERQSRLSYQKPANLSDDKYQAPCPLCSKPTYFWLDGGHIDGDAVKLIKLDYSDWKEEDGVCRRCFECYAIKAGKWYDSNLASTTDIYSIGFNKSKGILDYFEHIK